MPAPTSAIRERAPLLLVFGPLADRMAEIWRSRPSLTAKIAFAPPAAIHAIAVFLHQAPDVTQSDVEVGDLIEQSNPRELLKLALLNCPPRQKVSGSGIVFFPIPGPKDFISLQPV